MKLEKREIKNEWQPEKIDLLQLYNARADEAAKLEAELRKDSIDEDTVEAVRASLNSITAEAEKIASLLDNWDKPAAEPDGGARAFNPLATMEMRTLGIMELSNGNKSYSTEKRGINTMNKNYINAEIEKEKREFFGQFTEKRTAGDSTSMAAVIPTTVMGQYVIEKAPGALYEGASKTNIANSGTLKLPIAAVAGLTYTDGTNAVAYTHGGAPTYAEFVELAGYLGADYVGTAKWFMAPSTYFKLVAGLDDSNGSPILDASKKIEDNALLGYGFELDAQIPNGVIYFGDASRVHFNAARPAELNRWTNFDNNTEMAGIRAVAGAACETGAFVKMFEAAAGN